MTPNLEGVCQRIAADYRCGSHVALFLDYDGTLVPIADHPHLATLDRRTRRLLNRLARCPRVYVTIVSGRALDDLKALVPLRRLYFSGTGGMELDLHGTYVVHALAEEAAACVRELVLRLREALATFPDAWVEEKWLGCTVHYRAVPTPHIETLCATVQRVIACCPPRLASLEGPMAIEITPNLGWNKATAVRMVLELVGAPHPRVVYAGDGANDAVAMEAVAAIGGTTLGIGADAPAAGYRIASPESLREFLGSLLDHLEQTPTCRMRPVDERLPCGRRELILPRFTKHLPR